jgi:hypothetical protein
MNQKSLALLFLITAAALALRLLGVGFLLPQMTESDSRVIHQQVEHLERGDEHPERDRNYGFYPLLVARITACCFDDAPPRTPAADLEEHLQRASATHEHVRIVGAILSVLLVPATWLLARWFLSAGAALLAAAFAAASTLELWFAPQGRPHAAATAFAILAVVAAVNLRRRGRPIDYALAGVALALAVGSLESGLAVLPAFAVALLLREEPARRASIAWAALSLAILALALRWLYPFFFAESNGRDAAQLTVGGGTLNLFGHLIFLDQFRGAGFAKLGATLRDYDPWISALAVVGIVLAVRPRIPERWKDLAVLLAHAVPYAIAAGLYARTYQRFAMPLIPYLCLLAAYAAQRIANPLPSLARGAVLVLALAPQAWLAIRLAVVRREPDTIEEAARWIADHVERADKIVVLPSLELPLPQTPAALEENARMSDNPNRPWFRYLSALAPSERPTPAWNLVAMPMATDADRAAIQNDPAAYVRGLHAQWAVIEVYSEDRKPPVLRSVRIGLEKVAERVARFVPDRVDEGEDLPIVYQDDEFSRTSPWAWRAARARCVGPVMEVWRIREGG